MEELVKNPEQIIHGDIDAFVAQSKNRGGLLRVPFKNILEGRKILTVYWTSKVEKYCKGENNETKL